MRVHVLTGNEPLLTLLTEYPNPKSAGNICELFNDAGFALSLNFDATFNKYYPIWQLKLEADRRGENDSLD